REHALKVLDTDELLVRSLDQRLRDMTWDQIRAERTLIATHIQEVIAHYPEIAAMGVTDPNGIEWLGIGRTHIHQPMDGLSVTDREFWSGQQTLIMAR
ncbi:MAG TPA: hypothetical protein VHO91_02170, partial [Rhodopila sp.]|nr:hypothetical protein [Rhodopila sp.]